MNLSTLFFKKSPTFLPHWGMTTTPENSYIKWTQKGSLVKLGDRYLKMVFLVSTLRSHAWRGNELKSPSIIGLVLPRCWDQKKGKLTMQPPYDRSGVYAIHIAGRLDKSWADRLGGLTITFIEQDDEDNQPVTVLKGCLPDQAALLGVINTLYNLRYPLLFVRYLRPCKS